MSARKRILIGLAVVVALVVIAVGTVYVVTQTDWGRERVRRYVENVLNKKSHGIIRIGRVGGNLLKGVVLYDVSITDSAGAPFLKADEIWGKYSIRTLLGQKIDISDVRLVHPIIVLDKKTGGKWNYDRIFPRDTVTETGVKKKGWGDWIRFSNVTVLDGNLTIQSPWEPDPSLSAAERKDAIRQVFGPDERLQVVRTGDTFQQVMEFQKLNASFPLIRLTDPNYKNSLINIEALRTEAYPLRPPSVTVRNAYGTVEFTSDSTWWKGLRVALSKSNIVGDGKYFSANNDVMLRLHADPVNSTDLQWIHPRLPANGTGVMDFAMDWFEKRSVYVAHNANVSIAGARIRGDFGITVTDTIALHDTNLRFSGLDTRLIERIFPSVDSPLDGILGGSARLAGGTHALRVNGDVAFNDRKDGNSRVAGSGVVGFGDNARVNLDARLLPLSLATVGNNFLPSLGLRGTATGPVKLSGNLRNMTVNGSLRFNDGGYLDLRGTVDLASYSKGYNLSANARFFNANAIIARAPRMSLTGFVRANGRGFDPATMRANIFADIRESWFDTISVNAALVNVAIANGMANFDTAHVDLPQGLIDVNGSFGLAPNRSGELRYVVRIDSLSTISAYIPGTADTGVTQPRPRTLSQRVARARADSARFAEHTEVERAATGKGMPDFPVDTPSVINREEVSGSLYAAGVATGNIRNFSLRGTASGSRLVARGSSIDTISAEYTWLNARTPSSKVDVRARAVGVWAKGFALDSANAMLSYGKPSGTASIAVFQENGIAYNADAGFTLNNDRNLLQLNTMRLQFDTTVWASTRSSTIHWNKSGIDINELELRDQFGGRVYVDGRLPREGSADLHIAVDRFNIANAIAIAQSDLDARGIVSLDLRVTGTTGDPTYRGAFGAEGVVYNGQEFPEVHGTVSYADETLTGSAEAIGKDGRRIALAEGTVPVNLAITGVTGSRIPTNREIALNVATDSLPLQVLEDLSPDVVKNLRGEARGTARITGTLGKPTITGNFALEDARAKIVPAGITVNNIYASVRMLSDTIIVDSLVGNSSGRIAVTGGLGIGSLREPSFDLRLTSDNAKVLDNDRGELRADANLTMTGPFKEAYISGNARINSGVIYIPEDNGKKVIGAGDPALFNVLDTAVAENKEIFPAQSPLLANLRMDVNLTVDRGVFVRSTDANVEVYSDGDIIVHVNNAKESLMLDGVLLADRGTYTFMSKRFNVKRGSATFINSERMNPTIQATGEYEVRLPAREALIIRILIGGTLENLQIALESDAQPPISQSDLLAYLAFGRSSTTLLQVEGTSLTGGSSGSGSNLVGQGAALAARQLAGVAIGVFADEFAGSAARSLGADVFTLTPADVQSDVGGFLRGTEFEFGKYLNQRTFVSLTSRLDPAALKRPGFTIQHWLGEKSGYRVEAGLSARYLLREPSLTPEEPKTTSAFGLFLIREWRY